MAAVFAVAGITKLLDQSGSRRSLGEFGVPTPALPIAALLLPLFELATAVALILPGSARWGALGALLLLLGFVGGIANALRRGKAPDCHCFGQLHSAPAGRRALARNSALGALAAVVLVEGPGPSVGSWVSARTPAELVAIAAVAVALMFAAVALWLWRERRDLQGELADAQAEIAAIPRGLPVGTVAPSFALRDLQGATHTLESLLAPGRPVALVFISPWCGPCDDMLPELGRWQSALAARLTVAVISRGTAAENRPAAEKHRIGLLLQEDMEVMTAYRTTATPSALIVTPNGVIGSSVVGSNITIEPLIRLALRPGPTVGDIGPVRAEPPVT